MSFGLLNFAFGVIGGGVAVLFLYIIGKFLEFPPAILKTACILCFLVVAMGSFATYGPRVTVSQPHLPTGPERGKTKIESSQIFGTDRERVGQFDERIEDRPDYMERDND